MSNIILKELHCISRAEERFMRLRFHTALIIKHHL